MASARTVDQMVKDEVVDIMRSDVGKLTRWNKILEIFKQHNLCYVRLVKISECLVHRLNRGGLGLNAYNAHKTLAVIKAVGCDREHLKKATAFEFPSDAAELKLHMDCNRGLISGADGLLAPMSGQERLLTVACSHTVAGFRAAAAGCRSSEPSLQHDAGKINMESLTSSDPVMKDVIDNGLEFLIIPDWVANVFGAELAELAQSALNAEHSAYNQASELQVMSTMAIYASTSDGGSVPKDEVIKLVAQSQPPSLKYLSTLYTFTHLYGGGPGAPMVKYRCARYNLSDQDHC